jgi:hypothetical protein
MNHEQLHYNFANEFSQLCKKYGVVSVTSTMASAPGILFGFKNEGTSYVYNFGAVFDGHSQEISNLSITFNNANENILGH